MDIENGTEFLQILCQVMRQGSFSAASDCPSASKYKGENYFILFIMLITSLYEKKGIGDSGGQTHRANRIAACTTYIKLNKS
jgi:hypothetical protein